MTILLAFLLALASLAGAFELSAQTVHPGLGVRIRAPSVLADRFEGVFLGRSGDTLMFGGEHYGPIRVPASALTTLELSRGRSRLEGAKTGALWGGGIYLGMGLVLLSSDSEIGEFLPAMAAYGAGLGATIGAIIGRRAWKRAEPRLLAVATPRNIHSLGMQLAVRF